MVVPALIITIGSVFLPDTENSMVDRGQHDEGREELRKFAVLMIILMKNSMILMQLVKHLYAPVLFNTFGFGNKASLVSAVIISIVNVVATMGKRISFPWRS